MKIILVSTLLFFFFSSFAQNGDLNLSKYKLPAMKRQSLDFLFNSQGSYGKDSEEFDSVRFNNIRGSSESYSNLHYQLYVNTPKRQTRAHLGFNGSFDKVHNRRVTSENSLVQKKEDQLNSWLTLHVENKQFNENNWFWVAEPYCYMSLNRLKDKMEDMKAYTYSINTSLGLGGGKGRIEQVQDFRQAILMLNEFSNRGVLTRAVTEHEVLEIAMLLSQLKNSRFFDARLRKEKDLVAIDSMLTEKGLIDEKSISYYYGLEDMWTYGALHVRESGNQIRFVITPVYNLVDSQNDPFSYRSETRSLLNELVFESEKPLSLKWQRGYRGGIYSRYIKGNQNEDYSSTVSLSGELGFYPNTRTWLAWEVSSSVGLINFAGSDENHHVMMGVFSSMRYNYYISERVRLNIFSTLSYSQHNYRKAARADISDLSLSTNISFSYSLF